MFHKRKKRILLIGSAVGLCAVVLCLLLFVRGKTEEKPYFDLETLQKKGYIRVGILQNTTDYYLDNGNIQGFQYELVELLAKELNLMPRYVVYNTYWDNFYALLNNEVDLLAINSRPTVMNKQFFTHTYSHSFFEHLPVKSRQNADSLPQSWVVRHGNNSLCNAVDKWLEDFVQTASYKQLAIKYFHSQSANRKRLNRQQRLVGSISVYDKIIKKQAKANDLDWRFVSAIIFQESKFNLAANGRGGAFGLMQMMPATAQRYGIDANSSAEEQIIAGCKHIGALVKKYRYTDSTGELQSRLYPTLPKEDDLLKIVLMAYNTGGGYTDAVRNSIQEKHLNPDCWQNIEHFLHNISKHSFTSRRSKAKAKSALKYVYEVRIRYAHYKNMAEE